MHNTTEQNNLRKKSIVRLLSSIRNLPSVPAIIFEVSKLLNNTNTSAADLGRVISRDQGLVAKILTVANSPLYGLPRRVATIEFAIVILGFDHIKQIVMALSMLETFRGTQQENWDNQSYINHSLITASVAKRIADELGYQKSGEVFTAGLLHDVGIIIIQKYFNKEFNLICEMVDSQQMLFLNAEELILGLTHQDIGQFIISQWNFPEALGDSIAHHHNPSESQNNRVLSAIIQLADYIAQSLGSGYFYWDDNIQLDDDIVGILNFGSESRLNDFIRDHIEIFNNQLESITI